MADYRIFLKDFVANVFMMYVHKKPFDEIKSFIDNNHSRIIPDDESLEKIGEEFKKTI